MGRRIGTQQTPVVTVGTSETDELAPRRAAREAAAHRDAFRTLYAEHCDEVKRRCLAILRDEGEAEDAVQETFTRAWHAIVANRLEENPRPWLRVVARNYCYDLLRKRGHSQAMEAWHLDAIGPLAAASDEAVLGEADAALVRESVRRMPASYQAILALREEQELSYREIAVHESIPISAVESRLHRARSALRREYLRLIGPEGALAGLAPGVRSRLGAVAHLFARSASQISTAAAPIANTPATPALSMPVASTAIIAASAIAAAAAIGPVMSAPTPPLSPATHHRAPAPSSSAATEFAPAATYSAAATTRLAPLPHTTAPARTTPPARITIYTRPNTPARSLRARPQGSADAARSASALAADAEAALASFAADTPRVSVPSQSATTTTTAALPASRAPAQPAAVPTAAASAVTTPPPVATPSPAATPPAALPTAAASAVTTPPPVATPHTSTESSVPTVALVTSAHPAAPGTPSGVGSAGSAQGNAQRATGAIDRGALWHEAGNVSPSPHGGNVPAEHNARPTEAATNGGGSGGLSNGQSDQLAFTNAMSGIDQAAALTSSAARHVTRRVGAPSWALRALGANKKRRTGQAGGTDAGNPAVSSTSGISPWLDASSAPAPSSSTAVADPVTSTTHQASETSSSPDTSAPVAPDVTGSGAAANSWPDATGGQGLGGSAGAASASGTSTGTPNGQSPSAPQPSAATSSPSQWLAAPAQWSSAQSSPLWSASGDWQSAPTPDAPTAAADAQVSSGATSPSSSASPSSGAATASTPDTSPWPGRAPHSHRGNPHGQGGPAGA